MDGIIRIEKTFEQRLQEYRDIFTGGDVFSLKRIRNEFSIYLEMQVDPQGWEAIWKVPKITCRFFKIDFPTILLVFVENIDWKKLAARIKVVAVLDDIHLPEFHLVPLIQLWPLQKRSDRNYVNICNALDVVRFFYINLYMPWDDENDTDDWVERHLESRLQIFYNLKTGVFPRNMAKHVRYLLTTAKNLQEDMQSVVCEEDLIDLQVSLLEIQKEIELLENHLARKVLIERAKYPIGTITNIKQWLICDEGTLDDFCGFINESRNKFIENKIVIAPNLSDAWDSGAMGNNFILKRGTHYIDNVGILEEGGSLTTSASREETGITCLSKTVMFDFSADVSLENLTLTSSAQTAIIIRKGKLSLTNCKFVHGDIGSDDCQGIVVLNGATLEMINCTFVGFKFAIIANRNSSISIKNCEILDANYGLKIYDDCIFELKNSKINGCRGYGIWVEAIKPEGGQQLVAGFSVLNKYDLNYKFKAE